MQSNLNEEREKNLCYNSSEPYICGHNCQRRLFMIVGDHEEKSNGESINQEEGDEYEEEI